MKTIYIILSQSGTTFSKILKLFTKEKYNHSSICIDDNFNEFFSFGRKKVDFLLPGGFIKENAFTHVFGKFKNIPCIILKKEITDEQYEKLEKKIKYFITNKNNFSYACLSLILANTSFSVTQPNKFFCSQFVATLLNNISVSTPKKPEHMHPMDFVKINDVKIVYEGDLKKFCKAIYSK